MDTPSRRLFPQPGIAILTDMAAAALVFALWVTTPLVLVGSSGERAVLLTFGLFGSALLAYHFPIHLRMATKSYMFTVIYYLAAVLLPEPLAVVTAGMGALAGEVSVRSRTQNYPSDIATVVGRVMLIVAVGTMVAHVPVHRQQWYPVLLLSAALAMWLMEHGTTPLLFYPLTGESPLHTITLVAREGGSIEGAQLLIGILGVLAAQQQIWSLVLLTLPTALVYAAFKRAKELDDGTRRTLESIADTVDLRDPYTGGHSRRVTEYVERILHELGKDGPEVDLILWAARVHDIGKIGIPDGILNKPGPLTVEERVIMESHADKGAEFLHRYPQFQRGVDIVRHHHESWDGTGYPHRLRETAIPFGSRVIAVADSYDAMTSDRPYRKGMTPARAASILREGRGVQWDGAIVDAFLRAIAPLIDEPLPAALRLVTPEEAELPA